MSHKFAGTFTLFAILSLDATARAQSAASSTPPASAPAQASAGPSADALAEGRTRFNEGVRLAQKHDWPKAYAAFLDAWKLVQNVQIALNLAQAELKVGKYADAAEHLQFSLRSLDLDHPDVTAARDWLAQAKKHVATLTISVPKASVEVLIDDRSVGTPIPPEVFVEPGTHTIVARAGKTQVEETGTFSAGEERSISLEPKEPVRSPVLAPISTSTAAPLPAKAPSTSPLRPALLVTGGVVSLGLLGAGAGFLVAFEGTKSDLQKQAQELRGSNSISAPCHEPTPAMMTACKKNADTLATANFQGNVGLGLLVSGGVVAAGTLGAYLLWKPANKSTGTIVVPFAGASSGGFLVQGKF